MLISHKNNFVTIDIPKTGTRSLRQTLLPLNIVDIVGSPTGEFEQHGDVRSCRKKFVDNGWDIDRYFKFCVVRNPWKRYVSYLNYYFDDILGLENGINDIEDWSEDRCNQALKQTKIFNDLKKCKKSYLKYIISSRKTQDFYILNFDGSLGVDFVAQTESLQSGFNVFCNRTGVKIKKEMVFENKSRYPKHYTEYYTEELINMVGNKESWVLDEFSYKFK